MATYTIQDTSLVNIADAIRAKTGDTAEMTPAEMVVAIQGITTGGGDDDVPATITGGTYFDYGGDWDYFVNKYADRISIAGGYDLNSIFYESELSDLSDVSMTAYHSNHITTLTNTFYKCYKLQELPQMSYISTVSATDQVKMLYNYKEAFNYCYALRIIPDDWLPLNTFNTSGSSTTTTITNFLAQCFSLQKVPKFLIQNQQWGSSTAKYTNAFQNCYYLQSITDLPVSNYTLTTNNFTNAFRNCFSLKHLTFKTNNGTPKTAQWKNQVIDLTYTGNLISTTLPPSGNPIDTTGLVNVNTNALYNAHKNSEDWYSRNYFTYTRESAVETINSLPDTHAYGTNTIKFGWNASWSGVQNPTVNASTGNVSVTNITIQNSVYTGQVPRATHIQAGNWPDELSAEEIAVATAKGWTVTILNTISGTSFDP